MNIQDGCHFQDGRQQNQISGVMGRNVIADKICLIYLPYLLGNVFLIIEHFIENSKWPPFLQIGYIRMISVELYIFLDADFLNYF